MDDALLVDADSVEGEGEFFGNVPGSESLGQELEDFLLPAGEGDEGGAIFAGADLFEEAVDDVPGDGRAQEKPAVVDFADGPDDLGGGAFLL